jgi:hypothetical protein
VPFRRRRPALVPLSPARGIAGAAAVLTVFSLGAAQGSYSSIKSTGSSSWAAGDVVFTANSPAGALFTVTGAIAGTFGTSCVKLTYNGSLPATVRMYVSAVSGTGLESYLGVQVRSGTGNNANCSDFVVSTTDYNTTGLTDYTKTLSALRAASYDYPTGVSSWSATNTAPNNTRTYQLSWFVLPDNTATSRTVSFDVTWEARS